MPLRGNWLRLGRTAWLATATLALIIVVASVVVRFQAFDTRSQVSLWLRRDDASPSAQRAVDTFDGADIEGEAAHSR